MEIIKSGDMIDITECADNGVEIEIHIRYKFKEQGKIIRKIERIAPDIEIDIFALGIDKDGRVGYGEDLVYFANKTNPSESMALMAEIERPVINIKDFRKKGITFNDEAIGVLRVELSKLPDYLESIRFGLSIYNGKVKGQDLNSIEGIDVVIKGAEEYRYSVEIGGENPCYIMELGRIELSEEGNVIAKAEGIRTKYRTINEYAEAFNSKEGK